MNDLELLREYAEHRSERAFAELVTRHFSLVYSTAIRVVGKAHLAQDVVQMVFIDLARKAGSLLHPRSVNNRLRVGAAKKQILISSLID